MLGITCASLLKAHASSREMSFPLGKKGFLKWEQEVENSI
jgi:hypothetical protein